MIVSNVVKTSELRRVQKETLEFLKNSLIPSFGPKGSTTIIFKQNMLTKYSKDGHTILSTIQPMGVIEKSVKQDIEDITRHIVKNVGDGTTSAVILSYLIFKGLCELETSLSPYDIMAQFKEAVEKIDEEIDIHKNEVTCDDIYKIALISTNGNEEVASNLRNIYKEYGMGVFIDVTISNTTENLLKVYDGMTLDTGYSDSAYINTSKGICSLRNPKIYAFEDPIDTPEMVSLFDAILRKNIYEPASDPTKQANIIPTVIMAPHMSRDMSSYMSQLINMMYSYDAENATQSKPPFLFITNIYNTATYSDIAKMCGCKTIHKYIDLKLQDEDIKKGLAPTPETIATDFCGSCELIESDLSKSKFVNPKLMLDENGEKSITFKSLVEFLEKELAQAYKENEDANVTGTLKRRINSLKANMVEYLVGGVSMSDRDSVRDLVEDAVLNCRSAANNGYGFGANFEGLRASIKIAEENLDKPVYKVIASAYKELVKSLYKTAMDNDKADEYLDLSLSKDMPFNLKTEKFDGKVLCSITTDKVILDGISKIITLMYASNQFLCPSFADNNYTEE